MRVVTWVLIRMGVAAAASQLGWSDKTKALVLLGLLVVGPARGGRPAGRP